MMAAGFERHEQGRVSCPIAGGLKRVDLGMRSTESLVPPFGNQSPFAIDDHRADWRIRLDVPDPLPGQGQRPLHNGVVIGKMKGHVVLPVRVVQ